MRFWGRTKMQIQDSVTRMEGSSLSGTRVARGRDNEARDWFVLALREMNRVAQRWNLWL